jgi:hypothetical protein
MALVIPSAAITRHWSGALPARLRRAPLERFLRSRGLEVTNTGAAKDSDNVTRATVSIVRAGLTVYFQGTEDSLAAYQHGVVALIACSISRAVAHLIQEPASWRIAALVSGAHLLQPWIGLTAAAIASASATREFTATLGDSVLGADPQVGDMASHAVSRNDAASFAAVTAAVSLRLAAGSQARLPDRTDAYMTSSHSS